jgi:hypothetical protein
MSRESGSWWWLALRSLAIELLVPLGAACAAGTAVAALVSPAWSAAGLPYALGYGKNVESATLAAGFAAAAAARVASCWPLGRRLAIAASLLGALALAPRLDVAALLPAAPRLLCVGLLLAALAAALRAEPPGASERREDSTPRWLAAAAVALLAGLEGLLSTAALSIDVFHHGEVLASAVDLLAGGRPFESFVWPHGLHDTGLAALWLRFTGKIGTSPVALAWATSAGLGVVAAYVLARRLLASRVEALAATLALTLVPLLVGPRAASGAAPALESLGILLFVVLGFARVDLDRPARLLGAGALFGAAHLFRFETAAYGALSAAAMLVAQATLAAGRTPRQRLRSLVVAAAALACGGVLPLLAGRLLWGWPGTAWIEYLFGDLARHHRDAVGLVLRWPLAGLRVGTVDPGTVAIALSWLLFVAGLLAAAAGALAERLRRPGNGTAGRVPELIFLAVFALCASRSALDRIDFIHVLQWAALPALGVLLLLLGALRERRNWSAARSALAVAALLTLVDPGRLAPRRQPPVSPAAVSARIDAAVGRLGEHLAPNAPAGACADRGFTASELGDPENRRFVDATCEFERLLDAHGVGGLAIADSAPWYWVRFGMRPPYREFSLSRAYTPAAQRRLIEDLRASSPEALLLPKGYRALRDFDVPGAVRGPVVEAYLRARRSGVRPTPTALGDLLLWNEPAPCASEASGDAPADVVTLRTRRLYHQPSTGLLYARGRATESATGAPLAALTLVGADGIAAGSVEYGLQRRSSDATGREPIGWELFARNPRGDSLASLRLQGQLRDGRVVRLELDPEKTTRLTPLVDPAWRDLAVEIDAAWALGLADRHAASGAPCPP